MTRALLVALFVALGCAGDPVPITNCTAGVQTACACPGGSQGAQRCAADGSGFGACMCEGVDAGADVTVVADVATDRAGVDALQLDAADAVVDAGPDAACPAGQVRCPGTPGCVDTMTSAQHCGGCGRLCSLDNTENSVCVAGRCAVGACRVEHADCDGNAANGCEARAYCGHYCASPCPANDGSTGGCRPAEDRCICRAGYDDCDGMSANGCEADLRRDPRNCGACSRGCGPSQTCVPTPGGPEPGACRPM